MKIKVGKNMFNGSDEEGRKLIDKASSFVKCGVYGIVRNDVIELVNMPMSKTQLKKYKRQCKGVKLLCNTGE